MSKEAEKLAEQLRDMVPGYRTPSHERGVLNDAIQTIRRQAEQIRELREALRICAGWVEAYGQPETRAIVRAALSNTKEPE